MIRDRIDAKQALEGGLLAGIVGGALLFLYMLMSNLMRGIDLWMGIKIAATPFIGAAAAQPEFAAGPVMAGILCHFAVSIGWGLIFGLLAFGLSMSSTIWAGLGFGLVVWFGMFYVMLPIVGAYHLTRAMPVFTAIVENLVFGVGLGVGLLPFQRTAPSPPRSASMAQRELRRQRRRAR